MLVTLPGIVDAGQIGEARNAYCPMTVTSQAVDVGWNGHNAARTGVIGYGDGIRIAGSYHVTELDCTSGIVRTPVSVENTTQPACQAE